MLPLLLLLLLCLRLRVLERGPMPQAATRRRPQSISGLNPCRERTSFLSCARTGPFPQRAPHPQALALLLLCPTSVRPWKQCSSFRLAAASHQRLDASLAYILFLFLPPLLSLHLASISWSTAINHNVTPSARVSVSHSPFRNQHTRKEWFRTREPTLVVFLFAPKLRINLPAH